MDARAIAAWRMHNLRLAGPPLANPVEVVRWLGAVQSQDYGPAKWSVASRAGDASDSALDDLFNAGAILRTHVLRPTWHFVLPDDIRLLLQVTGPRVLARITPRLRQLGLDEDVLQRSCVIIDAALRGGRHRTRRDLGDLLEGEGIDTEGQRLPHILSYAELLGVVCSGALQGKQHTYALLDERASAPPLGDDEAALAELTRRYFASHGPATIKDFSAWSSLTLADIRRALDVLDLDSTDHEHWTFWHVGPPPAEGDAAPRAHLLQLYDECLMGYRDSRGLLTVAGEGTVPAIRPAYNGVVLVDLCAVGEWKRTLAKDRVDVHARLDTSLTGRQRNALEEAAQRYGAFVGRAAALHVEVR